MHHPCQSLTFAVLSALALANPTPPDSSALVARQLADPQINVFCIDNNIQASVNMTDAFDNTCGYLATRELAVGEQVTNETCFDETGVCVTTLLVHKCGKPGTTTTIDYDSCMALFSLPFRAIILAPCKNGGYVGSPAPGACWTALSVATLEEAENRLPALDEKAFTRAAYYVPGSKKRQAPTGVTACVGDSWANSVSYTDFFQDSTRFCRDMADAGVTLETGQSYTSADNYCNDDYCVHFNVQFSCVAPDGGPAHGNVTFEGCSNYFLNPWWGTDLVSGSGSCAEVQGGVIKGGWTTERYPDPCWNFTSVVLPPLSARAELPRPDYYVIIPNGKPLPPRTSDSTLLRRQADEAGVECSKNTFTDIFEAFCQLYEYCPFFNDETFNLTQHYDVLGQNVTLAVKHTGACIIGGKSGHDACVMALEEALEGFCKGDGTSGDQTVQSGACWDFDIRVEPN